MPFFLFVLIFCSFSDDKENKCGMFYGFYSTQPPPPPPPQLLTWCLCVKLNINSCFSSSKLWQLEILYFAPPCFQRLSSPIFCFFKSAFCSTFKNSVQRKNACVFIWRTKSVYSHHLILLFAHFVLHIYGRLLFKKTDPISSLSSV